MSTLPWMKFYPSDFMGSPKVRSMIARDRGIYISLLCHSWEEGSIPDDPNKLWMRCGVTPEQMREAWPTIRECFKQHPQEDGKLINERIEEERKLAMRRRESARKAGKSSAQSASTNNGRSNAR